MNTDNPFTEAKAWIDAQYAAGATQLGVTCNPLQGKLYLIADKTRIVITVPRRHETWTLKQMLHEYIGRLPDRG